MLLNDLKKYRIILASQSPRRIELLQALKIDFLHVDLPPVDESYPIDLYKNKVPVHIAEKKSLAYEDALLENDILITVDTIVWCRGEIFGKPTDSEDAYRMIKAISGNVHEVLTGVCLRSKDKTKTFCVASTVQFRTLTNDEITFYIENFKPYDKAGAYGIQEWIGYIGLERIEGSYFNVMGLPVQRLYAELESFIK